MQTSGFSGAAVDGILQVRNKQSPILTLVLVQHASDALFHGADHALGSPIGPRGMGSDEHVLNVIFFQQGSKRTCKLVSAIRAHLQGSTIRAKHVAEQPVAQVRCSASGEHSEKNELAEVIHAYYNVGTASVG
jgi:hypothetical protein